MSDITQKRQIILTTLLSNSLMWFNFTVYGFFSVFIARNFFPAGNEWNALLLATATFGVGFIVRPIGGVILGSYADRYGHKTVLVFNMLLMVIGTGAIAITPTYASIGLWAPFIVVIARLLQGLAAGAEMGSTTAFLKGHAPHQQQGYYTSWIQTGINFSLLLGSSIGALLALCLHSSEALYDWGWRIPFLFGFLLGPLGWYWRSKLIEPEITRAASSQHHSPLRELFLRFPSQVLASSALVILWTVNLYLLLIYMTTYAIKILRLSPSISMLTGIAGSLTVLIFCPVFGALSDRLGRKIFHLVAAALTCLLAYPMFWYVNENPGLISLLIFRIVFGLLMACYEGPLQATLSEIFPTQVLCTGFSLTTNVSTAIFGGFSAFIVTWLIKVTSDPLAPAFYLIAAALLSLVGTFFIREKHPETMKAYLTAA